MRWRSDRYLPPGEDEALELVRTPGKGWAKALARAIAAGEGTPVPNDKAGSDDTDTAGSAKGKGKEKEKDMHTLRAETLAKQRPDFPARLITIIVRDDLSKNRFFFPVPVFSPLECYILAKSQVMTSRQVSVREKHQEVEECLYICRLGLSIQGENSAMAASAAKRDEKIVSRPMI